MKKICVLSVLFCVICFSEFVIAGEIKWAVSHPYPLLGSLDKEGQEFWFPEKNKTGDIESFDEWYRRVSKVNHSPYFEMEEADRPWDAEKHSYRKNFLKQHVHSKTINITAYVEGVSGDCQWHIDGLAIPQKTCAEKVELDVPEVGALVKVVQGNNVIATQAINPKRIIVLGIGDSYSSGEGNPDKPTIWKSSPVHAGDYNWLKSSGHMAEPAQWLDQQCHRSFWNYQNYASLRLAAEDKTREVVFLHYSCSGAEVFDGLLVQQMNPPGSPKKCDANSFDKPKCMVHHSQLHAAVADLCPDSDSPNDNTSMQKVVDLHKLYRMDSYKNLHFDLVKCANPGYRAPDAILLSIGGNDVGFSSLVMWALLPNHGRSGLSNPFYKTFVRKGKVVCPELCLESWCKKPFDIHLINQLERRHTVLNKAITELLKVPNKKVVLNAYPDPIRRTMGNNDNCYDKEGLNYDNAWDGARNEVPCLLGRKHWEFNVLKDEARVLLESTVKPMNKRLGDIGKKFGYQYASTVADAFIGHGWCKTSEGDTPIYLPSTPKLTRLEGGCARNPSCFKPYHPRARFIRTVNDALMTQTSMLNDATNGSMHPTAQGQAAMAEATYSFLKSALGY